MKMQEIKKIAKKNNVPFEDMNKTELIRSIQRAEGNRDCFATPQMRDCKQMNCLWRQDCAQI